MKMWNQAQARYGPIHEKLLVDPISHQQAEAGCDQFSAAPEHPPPSVVEGPGQQLA